MKLAMANDSKKQHFVPKFLLREFADENDRLFVYDMARDRSFRSTVTDVGHENHFLTVPELDGDDGAGSHFEAFFQSFEDPGAKAVRDIRIALDSGVLAAISAEDRAVLADFIAVQYLRTPLARERHLQMIELMRSVWAEEFAKARGLDPSDPAIAGEIERIANVPRGKEAGLHGEHLLQGNSVQSVAAVLRSHVWLLSPSSSKKTLYLADHPVAVHGHVDHPGRGLGPRGYGAEVILPLSSRLLLSMVERSFVRAAMGPVEELDGAVFVGLSDENVLFERSLQAQAARQFLYCREDDFDDARAICTDHPELRDPRRPRVEALAFGKLVKPRRRS